MTPHTNNGTQRTQRKNGERTEQRRETEADEHAHGNGNEHEHVNVYGGDGLRTANGARTSDDRRERSCSPERRGIVAPEFLCPDRGVGVPAAVLEDDMARHEERREHAPERRARRDRAPRVWEGAVYGT